MLKLACRNFLLDHQIEPLVESLQSELSGDTNKIMLRIQWLVDVHKSLDVQGITAHVQSLLEDLSEPLTYD